MDKLRKKIILFFILAVCLFIYTIFWFHFFNKTQLIKRPNANYISILDQNTKEFEISKNQKQVLSSQSEYKTKKVMPTTYTIALPSRRQFFNLSCEIAAASAILHKLTNEVQFSPQNEQNAEKKLISEIGVSENPNLGIRIGKDIPVEINKIYQNLNEKFGGTDYYGVHAPPFIDLFAKYGLLAKPLNAHDDIKTGIESAIAADHLIMTWIKIGYGKPIDLALSYGTTIPLIKGEHTIVINGYDQNGVLAMDPGIGKERYIPYPILKEAISSFPIPFLEVYKTSENETYFSLNNTLPFDKALGLDRQLLTIRIENASKIAGAGTQMATILKDFGYYIESLATVKNDELENVSIRIKDYKKDYLYILKKDLALTSYIIATESADLKNGNISDAVITIGY